MRSTKKYVAIKVISIIVILVVLFLLFLGRALFAFCFLPLEKYECITIPEGRYVAWEELYECPDDIDDSETAWFPNCLLKWQIKQLAKHMQKNNLHIVPGEYEFYSTYYGDELIDSFDYIDANNV